MQCSLSSMKKFICIFAAAVLCCGILAHSAPTEAGAVQYLQKFGYSDYNPRLGNIMSQLDLNKAIKTFQRFAGLPQSGVLDQMTLDKMDAARCGNPDIAGTEVAARKKRYALQGSIWHKKDLTYKIKSHTSDLRKHETEKAIADAFKEWEKESGLTFKKLRPSEKADIEIEFARGAHGDGDPFDGPSKTLAHAYFPQYGGNAHFDEDETWKTSPGIGAVSLFIVAAHEFGHSLGLSHSDNNNALMAPFYSPVYNGLHTDDILAIRRLYGRPEDRNRPKTTTKPRIRPTQKPGNRRTTTKTPPVGACNGRFDAITMMKNGTTYAFKEDQFWRLNDQGMEKGYPKSIRKHWGFYGKVDASLSYGDYTDIFQGKNVRRFKDGIPARGYPKLISQVYKGMPSEIDTAYVWSGNGKIYFTKGDQYWRFNPKSKQADSGYPRPLSVWKGLPKDLDAALKWKDRTYFFKNGYYWRFDDEKIEVAQSLKMPYPRRSDEWWLGCSDNTLRSSPEETGIGDKVADDENGGNGSGSMFNGGLSQVMASTLLLIIISKLYS